MGSRVLALCSVVLVVFLVAPRAEAATWQNGPPDGTRWESGRVTVVVHFAHGIERHLGLAFGRQIAGALSDWNRSDVVHLTVVPSPAVTGDPCAEVPGAIVLCMSSATGDDVNYSGWTQTYTDVSGFSSGVVVWFNLGVVRQLSRSERRSLACHELGHAIGLVHRDGASCMNAITWPVHPDPFDYQTLDALYARVFGIPI